MNQEFDTPEAALEHFGVKGMRWGVRRERRLDRLNRVASGKGSLLDKARVGTREVSAISYKRHGGLKGAASNRASQLEARKKRIQTGKATVKDFMALHGADKIVIL